MATKRLLSLALGVMAVLIILTIGSYQKQKEQQGIIDHQSKEVDKLYGIIRKQEEVHKIELTYRIQKSKEDSLQVVEVKQLKLRDSLRYVRSISSLITDSKKLSDNQLDSALIREFKRSLDEQE